MKCCEFSEGKLLVNDPSDELTAGRELNTATITSRSMMSPTRGPPINQPAAAPARLPTIGPPLWVIADHQTTEGAFQSDR